MVTPGTGTHHITLTHHNSLQLCIHHPNTCPPLCPRDVSLVSISRPQARLHQGNQARLQAVAAPQSLQGQCPNIVLTLHHHTLCQAPPRPAWPHPCPRWCPAAASRPGATTQSPSASSHSTRPAPASLQRECRLSTQAGEISLLNTLDTDVLTEPWDLVATCDHGTCGTEECGACRRELDTILATCGTYLDT